MQNRTSCCTLLLALIAGLAIVDRAQAFRSGPPTGVNGSTASGGTTCTACHLSGAGSGMVEILGAPSNYAFSTTYNLTVRVSDPVQAGAGFQLSAEDAGGAHVGTLVITDATNTQLNTADWVNHTSTGVSNAVAGWAGMGNAAEFNVDWISPASDVGPVTFWAAGNAINDNFSSSGDLVYVTSTTANAQEPVPATSTWGLIVLTLVMLVAASTLLGRRMKPVRVAA